MVFYRVPKLTKTVCQWRVPMTVPVTDENKLLDKTIISSVKFSLSVVSDSLRPHGLQHARPPCPSPTPGAYSNSCPLSRWFHPIISSSVVPFSSCPQSFPESGSFPVSQFFASGGQSTGVSASASVLPVNIQCKDWCWSWVTEQLNWTDAEAKAPMLWPPDVKSQLIGKDPDPGKDWGQEKRMKEDEMVECHHRVNGHEFKQTQGDSGGQGSLACCSLCGYRESDII